MELKGQQPGFEIKQVNIVINSLGGYSKGLWDNMRSIVAEEWGKRTCKNNAESCSNKQSQHYKIM